MLRRTPDATAVFVTASAGIAALLGAAHFASIAIFIVVFGLVRETHLLPLVIGESLVIQRLGSILGFVSLFATIGFATGPAIAGRIRRDRELLRRLGFVHRDGSGVGASDARNLAASTRNLAHGGTAIRVA